MPGRDGRATEAGAHAPSMPEGAEEENVRAFEMRQRLAVDEQRVVDGQVVMTGFLAGLGSVEHDRSQLAGMSYLEGAPRASMEGAARGELFDDRQVDAGVVFPTISILWDSDDPHIDSSIHAPEQIRESVASLSEQRRKLVLGENARSLFQLG